MPHHRYEPGHAYAFGALSVRDRVLGTDVAILYFRKSRHFAKSGRNRLEILQAGDATLGQYDGMTFPTGGDCFDFLNHTPQQVLNG